MHATLSFDLPDEQIEFDAACQGLQWRDALADVTAQVRQWRKYGHPFSTPEHALDAVHVALVDVLYEYHLHLD